MFARLDFPRFLVCYSGHLSGNKSEEKASVAICGGLSHNLAYIDWPNTHALCVFSLAFIRLKLNGKSNLNGRQAQTYREVAVTTS